MEERRNFHFRSGALIALVVIFSLAAVLGTVNLADAFLYTEYDDLYLENQQIAGVTYVDSVITMFMLRQLGQAGAFLWPAVLAVGLILMLAEKKGLEMLSGSAKVCRIAFLVVRWIMIALFAFRLIRGVISYVTIDPHLAIYSVPSLLLSEGILAAIVFFAMMFVIRFFAQASDAAVFLSFAQTSAEAITVRNCSLVKPMLIIMAVPPLIAGISQLATGSASPVAAISLLLTAVGNLLLALRLGKTISQLELAAYRRKKQLEKEAQEANPS